MDDFEDELSRFLDINYCIINYFIFYIWFFYYHIKYDILI